MATDATTPIPATGAPARAADKAHKALDTAAATAHKAVGDALNTAQPDIQQAAAAGHQAIDQAAAVSACAVDWLVSKEQAVAGFTQDTVDRTRQYIASNPLQSAGIALAVGYVLGRLAIGARR